jgi:hypothetical protein
LRRKLNEVESKETTTLKKVAVDPFVVKELEKKVKDLEEELEKKLNSSSAVKNA